MDKRGQMMYDLDSVPGFGLLKVIIVSFLAVMFFAGLLYTFGLINNVMHDTGVQNDKNPVIDYSFPCINDPSQTCHGTNYVNMTKASDTTFGNVYQSMQAIRLLAITFIFSLIIGVFIVNATMKINPALFFVYVLIIFFAVIFSAPVSNAYETLLNQNVYEGLLSSFTGANWLMLNLPMIITIVGLIGGVFLFVNMMKTGADNPL